MRDENLGITKMQSLKDSGGESLKNRKRQARLENVLTVQGE